MARMLGYVTGAGDAACSSKLRLAYVALVVCAMLVSLASSMFAAESCTAFSPNNVQAKLVNGRWVVADGTKTLASFAAQTSAQTAVKVIKAYGMNSRCSAGALQYWRVNGAAPTGTFAGETVTQFNPARLGVVQANGVWWVATDKKPLWGFGSSQANANEAIATIRKYGFNTFCYVGTLPDAITYFKKVVVATTRSINILGFSVPTPGEVLTGLANGTAVLPGGVSVPLVPPIPGVPTPPLPGVGSANVPGVGNVPVPNLPGVGSANVPGVGNVPVPNVPIPNLGSGSPSGSTATSGSNVHGAVPAGATPIGTGGPVSAGTNVGHPVATGASPNSGSPVIGQPVGSAIGNAVGTPTQGNVNRPKPVYGAPSTGTPVVGTPNTGSPVVATPVTATPVVVGTPVGTPVVTGTPAGNAPGTSGTSGPSPVLANPNGLKPLPNRPGQIVRPPLGRPLRTLPPQALAPSQEDAIPFDYNRVAAKLVAGSWKVVQGDMWMLDFGANGQANAQKAVDIIKHYRMNSQCFVGRPNPPFEYWLSSGKAPAGPFPGEDRIPFNPSTVEAKNVGGRWKIVDGNSWLFDFGTNQAHATSALNLIKKYGFNSVCYVGRPNPPMTYLRKDTPLMIPPPGYANPPSGNPPSDNSAVNPGKVAQQPGGLKPVPGNIRPNVGNLKPPVRPIKPVPNVTGGSNGNTGTTGSTGAATGTTGNNRVIPNLTQGGRPPVKLPNGPITKAPGTVGATGIPTHVGPPQPVVVQEDCLPFDYRQVQSKRVGNDWMVVYGNDSIMNFGSGGTAKNNANRAVQVIKHYKMTSRCYVGRPNAPFQYWLVNGQSPVGLLHGEDRIPFDPNKLEVKQIGSSWFLIENPSHSMFNFGTSQVNAQAALNIIKKYGFTSVCYVGRPNAPMQYFRK